MLVQKIDFLKIGIDRQKSTNRSTLFTTLIWNDIEIIHVIAAFVHYCSNIWWLLKMF